MQPSGKNKLNVLLSAIIAFSRISTQPFLIDVQGADNKLGQFLSQDI